MIYKSKQMLIVRRDLKMRKGKIAAQASHASVEAVLKAILHENRMDQISIDQNGCVIIADNEINRTPLTDWFRYGMAKICVYVDSEEELLGLNKRAQEAGIITALILDAGMTEFHGEPTYTALAFEPLDSETADLLTGLLPLY